MFFAPLKGRQNTIGNQKGLVQVSSRPFRANRLLGCFPGLKAWLNPQASCGAKKAKIVKVELRWLVAS
jgi:hypothetical protein